VGRVEDNNTRATPPAQRSYSPSRSVCLTGVAGRDSVPVLVGAHCSPATAAVIPLAERQKVLFVTGIPSAPSLTATRREWFFRLPPTEAMTANVAVPY
jgi:branched-chain amino acid transport system substrate-binding protein